MRNRSAFVTLFLMFLMSSLCAIPFRDTLAQPIPPEPPKEPSTTAIIEFIKSCQSSEGGFFDPYPLVERLFKIPNLYSTYFAVMALKDLNSQPKDVSAAIKFLRGKQDPYGGFFEVFPYLPDSYPSNSTVISTHHALAALKALGSEPDNVQAVIRWLKDCQKSEGYFAFSPHGEFSFFPLECTCLAVLALECLVPNQITQTPLLTT